MKHLSIVLAVLLAAAPASLAAPPISFNRDIRPILSRKCFSCHGPDVKARKARLRLDERASAVARRGDAAAIVPGNAASSAMVARVLAEDPHERMPPARSGSPLTAQEIQRLRDWIDQGARYQPHWAFEPLQRPAVPGETVHNPIDAFVAAKLREHGLRSSPEAVPEVLLRRVTLDLTGLPPTAEEWHAFRTDLAVPGSDARACYERVVDRLLASPHFGEHLAVGWLDAARYADTNGYFSDKPRQMWPWRDWVVDAYNANLPFDQFTLEQLAGDLLPGATVRQRVATGFNRNHMANNETGIIDEEFRTEYVVDRVHTTMTTWLGLTAGCAQCHDHKFDPIAQREFYQLFAFFNNVPETGLIVTDNPPPSLEGPTPEQVRRLGELTAESAAAASAFEPIRQRLAPSLAAWESKAPATLPQPPTHGMVWHEPLDGVLQPGTSALGTTLVFEEGLRGRSAKFDATQHLEARPPGFDPDGPWTIGFWMLPEGPLSCPLSLIEPAGDRRGLEVLWMKGLLKVHLVRRWGVEQIEIATTRPLHAKYWHQVVITHDGSRKAAGLRIYTDGMPAKVETRLETLMGSVANAEPLRIGRRDDGLGFYGRLDEVRVLRRNLDGREVADWFRGERLRGVLATPAAKRHWRDADFLLDDYLDHFADRDARAARRRAQETAAAVAEFKAAIPTVLVMQERDKPRQTRVLERGRYDRPGDVVEAGVPVAVAPWPSGAPRNRLGFARWLLAPDNPLTPRVAANRLWQHCFGEGLVRTVDDFGSQGEPPPHPELLDWLATTFRDDGWDVKRLLRRIVTSQTYKQRSHFLSMGPQVFDPENRLLARGPSGRLSAEALRDQALALSGLLVRQVGGPSVKPYQPPGLWEAVSYNAEDSYVVDAGAGRWRRSLYTYVKRQVPPPALLAFDGPTREKCTMRRPRTNTPVQALLLLNDETYVEAARALASYTLQTAGSEEVRLQYLWRTLSLRNPDAHELSLLRGLLGRQRGRFANEPEAAKQFLAVGFATYDARLASVELAAWTVVAHTLLNTDEVITKR